MKDTIRLILFTQCNMRCSYCCNEQEQFNSQFHKMHFEEIDFSPYKNISITGGEPFLWRNILYDVLNSFPSGKNIYLYTNGILINNNDITCLASYNNLKCINVGIHTLRQLKAVNPNLERALPVRFMVQDKFYDKLLNLYPERVNNNNLKAWKMNECNMPNEDWVQLI